jgi:hypothetical protein
VVLILPGPGGFVAAPVPAAVASQAADPLIQMIAEQNAMMREMTAELNAAFAQPIIPLTIDRQMNEMIAAAMRGLPPATGGSGMVFTSTTAGPGTCSEQVTYVYPGNDAKPRVTMTRSGDACGVLGSNGPVKVEQNVRPRPVPQAMPARGAHLWTVGDPPHEMTPAGEPRT